jgi:predicted metal-dependent HD superfamily phosphohydrolase
MDFKATSDYVMGRLHKELKQTLSYHSVAHTLDVISAIRRLADAENIDMHDKVLLETAALFHDAGMIIQYKDHESASVVLACEVLPGFGYADDDIVSICQLIMVTKLPQYPGNHLEQIICDADLDYLGREDFYIHSFKLRLEWQVNGIRETTLKEWFDIQVKFLGEHRYFTKNAIELRHDTKMKHLHDISELLKKADGSSEL